MGSSPQELDHVVAIGASAGGLEAIQELIAQLPAGSGATYVVAQHLAPDHPSQLADLLRRSTRLSVIEASARTTLSPGRIVVIPPNCDATFEQQELILASPQPRFGPSPSIDRLFESLADLWGERGVAVVLSGTGSDGACGLRAVGSAGGLTLVQSPESARFDGMPRAAIALGSIDLVADPTGLGTQLGLWLNHGRELIGDLHDSTPPLLLTSVAAQLKQGTGVDFSQYKESTLRRQLQRRMAIRGVSTIEAYLPLLSSDAGEAQALLQNLLVTVTSFFRNPDAFTALAPLLETLVARRQSRERLRVWVPACATGEEAYSLGMVVSEVLGHPTDLSQHLKIFATDLDEQSLLIGRRGVYPISAAKPIPEPLFERFCTRQDNAFEISKTLRSCIVFARHNVSEDPPFPNIDLISCRNALIYFTAPLQERVIDLFSFSLQAGGLLFLGSSESLGRTSGFSAVNPLHRIYERSRQGRARTRLTLAKPLQPTPLPRRPAQASATARETIPAQHIKLLEALIRTLAHPCLVLDENHDLVEVVGDVSPYCKIPEGRMTAAAGAYLRDELQSEARALFLLVRADRSAASSGSLQLPGGRATLRLEAAPLQVEDRALTVLSFVEEGQEPASPLAGLGSTDRDAAFAREIERLERELLSSQDSLRRSMADLEQANEELEASSEELQASSEELQSSNEELEASNEELQATNEELGGLNQQLRTRSDELERLNNDLENIQSSLSQGMVIVDRNLRIMRFSPLAVRVFGLVDSDIGQPLIGVPTTVPLPGLRETLLAIVNGDERRSIEATSEEVSYLAQVMPYRNREGSPLGAIITLTDVSELVALRRAAEASLREFASLADALDQVVWKRDHTMHRILYISRRVERLSGWSAEEICSHPGLLESAILPEDRASVAEARSGQQAGWSVTYRLTTRDGRQRTVQEVATRLDESNDHGVVGTLADVTEQTMADRERRLLAAGFQWLAQAEADPLALIDAAGVLTFANAGFAELAGAADPGQAAGDLAGLSVLSTSAADGDASATALGDLVQRVLERWEPLTLAAVRIMPAAAEPPGSATGETTTTLVLQPLGSPRAPSGVMVRLRPSRA
jgi:two-component system CheB/CheR fusion protein